MVWLLVLLAALALSAFTARTASERGRSGGTWAALAVLAGVAGFVAGAVTLGLSVTSEPTGDGVGGVILATVLSFVAPLLAMAAVLFVLVWLPERVPDERGHRWIVYRMSTKAAEGGDCELLLEATAILVGRERVAAADIEAIEVDGECLRVRRFEGGELLLMPRGETARLRTRKSLALRKRIGEALGIQAARSASA